MLTALSASSSIKKKVKGGPVGSGPGGPGPGPGQQQQHPGNNKTLPSGALQQQMMQQQQSNHNKNASLKFNRFNDDKGNGEPISSAIVKYNYQVYEYTRGLTPLPCDVKSLFIADPSLDPQAQQLDELSLVKGNRVMILEKSGDGWWRGRVSLKHSIYLLETLMPQLLSLC